MRFRELCVAALSEASHPHELKRVEKRYTGSFLGRGDQWRYVEKTPIGKWGDWEAALGLSIKNQWKNLSVEGATEADPGFMKALHGMVETYPELRDFVISFDGPYKPVSDLLREKPFDLASVTFLHGTSSANLKSIMEQGLKPRKGGKPAYGSSANAKPGDPNLVYLTTQEDMAKFAASDATVVGGKPVILAIRGIDPKKLVPDEDSGRDTASQSLAKIGSAAYAGTIPPSAISVYLVRDRGVWTKPPDDSDSTA